MEKYNQFPKPNMDIVIVDYMNRLVDDRKNYKEKDYIKMTSAFDNLYMDILKLLYNVDRNMLDKFKEVYGSYPTYEKFQGDTKRIERDKKRMLCLIRSLKINKIKNGK